MSIAKQFPLSLWFASFLLCLNVAQAGKPGGGGGGGGTAGNNVRVSYAQVNGVDVYTITGDGANNYLYVTMEYNTCTISPGIWNQTTINGQSADYLIPTGGSRVDVVFDMQGGSDTVWCQTYFTFSECNLRLAGGDGDDDLVMTNIDGGPGNVFGNLWMDGGKGNDSILLRGVNISRDLTISGGDHNDTISIIDNSADGGSVPEVLGVTLLDGGRGKDSLTAPAYFLSASAVAGFETVVAE